MVNAIIIAIVAAIVGSIISYIRKAKKKGIKCVGCPYAKQCGGNSCGCNSENHG